MPLYMEQFCEGYKEGGGFQKLLNFVLRRIYLKTIQLPAQMTQTIKAEEVRRLQQQQHNRAFAHQTQPSQNCLYCKNHHDTSMCDNFYLSLQDRVAVISKLRLCYHCFLPDHTAKSCPEKREVTCNIYAPKRHGKLFYGRHLLHSLNSLPNHRLRDKVEDDDDDQFRS